MQNCFHKTCGCCKTLCFPKTLFPPFSLTSPFFLFIAPFLGGGDQRMPGPEDSQAPSNPLDSLGKGQGEGGEATGSVHAVTHTPPHPPKDKCLGTGQQPFAHQNSELKAPWPPIGVGGVVQNPPHFRKTSCSKSPSYSKSAWHQSLIRWGEGKGGSFLGPFPHFLCLQQRGKFGNKSWLMHWTSGPSPSFLQHF